MAQNFLYPDLETERFNECITCNEVMDNPVCLSCLSDQLEAWLSYYPDLKKKLLPKVKKYVQYIDNSVVDAISCIVCKSKKAAMCNYCFVDYILIQLKKLQAHDSITGEFLRFFNIEGHEE